MLPQIVSTAPRPGPTVGRLMSVPGISSETPSLPAPTSRPWAEPRAMNGALPVLIGRAVCLPQVDEDMDRVAEVIILPQVLILLVEGSVQVGLLHKGILAVADSRQK